MTVRSMAAVPSGDRSATVPAWFRIWSLVCLWLLTGCSDETKPPGRNAEPLDVLVVIADDLASSAMTAFGGERLRELGLSTPNLDRLTGRGMRFRRAICASPFCTPSRQAFLTGRWPHEIGVTQLNSVLPPKSETMATVFARAGYRTAAFGKMHWGRGGRESSYGFEVVRDRKDWEEQLVGSERDAYEGYRELWRLDSREGWSTLNPERQPCPIAEERQLAPWLTERALDALSAEDPRPALVYLSFYEPHAPFSFPPRLRDAIDPDRIRLEDDWREELSRAPGLAEYWSARIAERGPFDEAAQRGTIAAYLQSVLWLDEQIGELWRGLEERGLAERTLICFWSDNGYFLGERGVIGKSFPYRAAAEVPVAVLGPGIEAGETFAPISTLDLFPTLCEWVGVPVPPALAGRSLAPVLRGGSLDARNVYCETVGVAASIQSNRHKWMVGAYENTGWDHFFDLEHDPTERHPIPIGEAPKDGLGELRAAMHSLLMTSPPDGFPAGTWMSAADPLAAIRWALRQIDGGR